MKKNSINDPYRSGFRIQVQKTAIYVSVLFLFSCALSKPKEVFDLRKTGTAPRYNDAYYWAALPTKKDPSDETPNHLETFVMQDIDVFFIHPTSYIYKKQGKGWNADLLNNKLNQATDDASIRYQASIFNESAKVYAPRYRQAVYHSFITKDSASKNRALDLAYEDVYNAFLYFYDHFNNNRPIAIVGHSQGALLGMRLVKEVFDNEAMKNKLVIAYLPGYPIPKNSFKYIKPCQFAEETSCVCSWRSYKKSHIPSWLEKEPEMIVTNPISWSTEKIYVPSSENKGMLIDMEDGIKKPGVGAQIYGNILWTDKPKIKGSFLLISNNYHRGDFNLFYMDVRQNFRKRIKAYWKN